ncbi:MAG: DoxX family protein [Candidatus Acidiferrales bacterium]|jgi:putative oxidoreductase
MQKKSSPDLFSPILSSDALMGPLLLAGRLFTTGIFVFYIYNEIVKVHEPRGLLYLVVLAQCVGVVLVALGYKTRFAAILLAVCIIATLVFFWVGLGFANYFVTIAEKVVAVAGTFLFMFAYGAGPLSLDSYLSRSAPEKVEDNSFFASDNVPVGLLLLVGRILSTFVFCYFGVSKILDLGGIKNFMVRHNPSVPTNLVYLAILTQIVAPALVLLGYKTRYGALALSGFCITATVLFHAEFGNPSEVEHFLLDFAIAGGFLFMFAKGPGPLSVDEWRGRTKTTEATQEALPGRA